MTKHSSLLGHEVRSEAVSSCEPDLSVMWYFSNYMYYERRWWASMYLDLGLWDRGAHHRHCHRMTSDAYHLDRRRGYVDTVTQLTNIRDSESGSLCPES